MFKIFSICAIACLSSVPLWAQDQTQIVVTVKSQLEATDVDLNGPCGAFQITGRVAWILRAEGWGLITKNPGQNGCSVDGRDRYAIDALAKQDGSLWVDLLINAETDNTPAWQLHAGSGQPSSDWAAPFDLGGPVTPPPSNEDHDAIVDLLGDLQQQFALETASLHEQLVSFRTWAEEEIAEVRAEHKAQTKPIEEGKTPFWQVLLGILSALAGTIGATR